MSKASLYHAFTTLSADGNTAAVDLSTLGTAFHIDVYFGAGVSFGSGNLQLQASPDGGTTWVDVPGAAAISAATANTFKTHLYLYGATRIRFKLAGSTTPTLNPVVLATGLRYAPVKVFTFIANGDSAVFTMRDRLSPMGWAAWGTWDSGVLTLKCSPDGGTTWFAVDSASANALKHTESAEEILYKFTLASAASAPAINVRVY